MPDDLVVIERLDLPVGAKCATAAFIGLAEALGCALLTADARLAASPGPRCEIQVLGC